MNMQKVLTTAVLGVGLGALTLPGIALANVGAHPSVAPVGTTITLTARCKPQGKGPAPSATFHVTGPARTGNESRDKENGPDRYRGSEPDRGSGTGSDRYRDHDSGREKDSGKEKDVSVESTGPEAKMPDTVSAQLPTHGWQPGEYKVSAKCNDGTVAGETAFTLTPEGGARSGDGGRSGNNTLIVAGTAMLGAGAVGFVLLRRRRPEILAA